MTPVTPSVTPLTEATRRSRIRMVDGHATRHDPYRETPKATALSLERGVSVRVSPHRMTAPWPDGGVIWHSQTRRLTPAVRFFPLMFFRFNKP